MSTSNPNAISKHRETLLPAGDINGIDFLVGATPHPISELGESSFRVPVTSSIAKSLAGIALERELPLFAESFVIGTCTANSGVSSTLSPVVG